MHERRFFLGSDWLVTAHERAHVAIEATVMRLREDPKGTLGDEYRNRDPFDPASTYGIRDEDRRHILNVSWNAFLPDAARGAMDNPFGRGLLNGWQLSGITTFASGQPLRLTFEGSAGSNGIAQAYYGTPNRVLSLRGGGGTAGVWAGSCIPGCMFGCMLGWPFGAPISAIGAPPIGAAPLASGGIVAAQRFAQAQHGASGDMALAQFQSPAVGPHGDQVLGARSRLQILRLQNFQVSEPVRVAPAYP